MFQHTLYSTRHDHDSPEDDYQRRLTSQPSVLQTFLIPPIWQNTGLAAAFHQCPDLQSCFVASHMEIQQITHGNQANARLNLENSSLKTCPKPSGQGFRPPQNQNACLNLENSFSKNVPQTIRARV